MRRYWFRVRIDKKENKVVKVLIQAPDYNSATKILKSSLEEYYPCYPDCDILNAQDVLSDDKCYVVIGDNQAMHYATWI